MKAQLKSFLFFSCILILAGTSAMAADCRCPEHLGAVSGTKPIIKTTGVGNYPGLILCGSLDFLLDDTTALASNFEIFSCGADTSLMFFDEMHICKVIASGTSLRITQYGRGPTGADWQWIDFPITEYSLNADLSRPVEQKATLKFRTMTEAEIGEALSRYHDAVASGFIANSETEQESSVILGSIWTAALHGDSSAFEALKEMWETLQFDDTFGETYMNLSGAYNAYAKEKGMPLLPELE